MYGTRQQMNMENEQGGYATMSRKLIVYLFILVLLLALAACGGTAEEETPEAGDVPVIGLVQIDRSHPFHLGEEAGATEAARRHGFDLRITSGEGDVNKQIEAFENLVNEGVDAYERLKNFSAGELITVVRKTFARDFCFTSTNPLSTTL